MYLIRRLGRYFVPYWGRIAASMICMALVGATAGLSAWLVKPLFDGIFIEKDPAQLKLLPLAIVGLYLAKGIFRYVQSYTMRWVGETVVLQMRHDLVTWIEHRDVAFFDRNPTGTLMSRVTNDVGLMQRAIPDLIQLLRQSVTIAGLIVVLFQRDWKLATAAMLVFPLAAYPLRRISVLMRHYARRSQAKIGDISNVLQELFTGIEVVKVFRCEEQEIARYDGHAERLRASQLKSARLNELTAPFMELLGAVGAAVIIWYGGSQVRAGTMTPGGFGSFLAALFMLYDPFKRAGTLNNTFQQALAAAERVFGLMDAPTPVCEAGGDLRVAPSVERIEFDRVRFSYDPAKGEVLRGVSFTALRDQVVAFVGLSGSGKSTLVKLLPRFYDPDSGSIRIDGVELPRYTLESLRGALAVVTQDTFLFNDTVRRNLLVGRPSATDEEVVAAARAAHADEFIRALPDGYETVIGERGDLLSGGQKQRLAIARALLKDAPILVLDEATSALDSASEREVQAAFEVLMRGRTSFVIAHRLSTVRKADQILVLREGAVVEAGTHDELLARDGEYARLCRLQLSGEDERGG